MDFVIKVGVEDLWVGKISRPVSFVFFEVVMKRVVGQED